jgi:hypothetical protein
VRLVGSLNVVNAVPRHRIASWGEHQRAPAFDELREFMMQKKRRREV